MSKIFKIIGEIEAYDLDKLTEDLFIFFQENDNIGTFSVDFKDDEVELCNRYGKSHWNCEKEVEIWMKVT